MNIATGQRITRLPGFGTRQSRRAVVVSGGGGAPVSGMAAWFKADALALSDGDPVTQWTDSSGNANHLAEVNSSWNPTYKAGIVNSLPVVRYASGFKVLSLTTRLTTVRTAFIVMKHSTGSDAAIGFFFADDTVYDWHAGSGTALLDPTFAHANIRTGSGYVNGVLTTVTSMTKPTAFTLYSFVTAGDVIVGNVSRDRFGANTWEGDIAEIVLYTSALSSGDRVTTEDYLIAKYAL